MLSRAGCARGPSTVPHVIFQEFVTNSGKKKRTKVTGMLPTVTRVLSTFDIRRKLRITPSRSRQLSSKCLGRGETTAACFVVMHVNLYASACLPIMSSSPRPCVPLFLLSFLHPVTWKASWFSGGFFGCHLLPRRTRPRLTPTLPYFLSFPWFSSER